MNLRQPARARIVDEKYRRFSDTFARMGLPTQEFRVISARNGMVIVHPEDIVPPRSEPVSVRRDMVEFVQD